MGISRRFLLSLPLVALAFTGCGGGDDEDPTTAPPVETSEATAALSKEELLTRGDAICGEVNAAVGTLGSTSSEAEGEAAQVAGLYSGMVERLQDLGAPSDDSEGYAEFIAAADALAQAEENVELAAAREDPEALSTAEAEASTALTAFQSAATSFGFEDCAEAPAPPVPGGGVGEVAPEEPGGVESELEEVVPEEEVAPEEAPPAEEESAGGGAGVGGGTEGGSAGAGGGNSGGIGPG